MLHRPQPVSYTHLDVYKRQLEQSTIENSFTLRMTHDNIARNLGSAREVVTRMLKYFQGEGLVSLSRGEIKLLDEKRLLALSENPSQKIWANYSLFYFFYRFSIAFRRLNGIK